MANELATIGPDECTSYGGGASSDKLKLSSSDAFALVFLLSLLDDILPLIMRFARSVGKTVEMKN